MADLGVKLLNTYCTYCRSALTEQKEKKQGHHDTCKYEISNYKEEQGYWYFLNFVNATEDDCITDENGRMLELNLSHKGLSFIPELPFKDLEIIDLSYNHLDRVEEWIYKLPHLKKVIFPGNGFSLSLFRDMLKLNAQGVHVISTGLRFENNRLMKINLSYIGQYMRIELLDLTEEIISYINNVKNVKLSYNSLTTIPEWIFELENLEEINLTGNYFPSTEFYKLLQLPRLKRLKISLQGLSTGMRQVFNKLERQGVELIHYESRYFW